MMTEVEDSSLDELESIAKRVLSKNAEKRQAERATESTPKGVIPTKVISSVEVNYSPKTVSPPQATVPFKTPAVKPKKARAKSHGTITTIRTAHRKELKDIKAKHKTERKQLKNALDEQVKKSRSDLKMWMEKAMKEHESRISKMVADNASQHTALRSDVKGILNGQTRELKQTCSDAVTSVNQEELERLVNWFHEEFMKEIDSKSKQYEVLKTSSENQANRMVGEIDTKNQRIKVLDQKILDIAQRLPKDVRQALFEELGLQHLVQEQERAKEREKELKKEQKKGFMSKLSSLFKKAPKKPKPVAQPEKPKKKEEQKKDLRKRQAPAQVIAE